MKKIMILSIVAISLVAAGFAFAGLVGSAHDVSATSGVPPCQNCHHPHTGNAASVNLLWNHANQDDTAYTTYGNAGVVDAATGFESWACMSCHDGQLGAGALYKGTNSLVNLSTGDLIEATGQELTNDHPVNVNYTNGTNGLKATATAVTFSGMVQCASCHDVHNGTNFAPMLYVSITASAVCTDCHNK